MNGRTDRIRPAWAFVLAAAIAPSAWSQQLLDRPPDRREAAVAADGEEAGEGRTFRYWTTTWSFQDFDVDTLTRRLARIGLELPVSLAGDATVRFEVSVPLNGLRNARAYRFQGMLTSETLRIDEVTFRDLGVYVDYADGRLTLSQLRGQLRQGRFTGQGSAQLVPREGFETSLNLRGLDLAPISELLARFDLGDPARPLRGQFDADLQASGQVETVADPLTWEAEGRADVADFAAGESAPFSATLENFRWQQRRLSVPRLSIPSADHPDFWMWLSGDVRLGDSLSFDLEIQADDLPAEDLVGLWTDDPGRVAVGKLDLKGKARGEIGAAGDEDFANGVALSVREGWPDGESTALGVWDVELDFASPQFRLFGVDLGLLQHRLELTPQTLRVEPLVPPDRLRGAPLGRLTADYRLDEQRVQLSALSAEVFDGTLDGEASLSLTEQGRHSLALRWDDLSPSVRLPIDLLNDPLTITGQSSGQIDWSAPAKDVADPKTHRGTLSANVTDLRLGEEGLGEIVLDAEIDADAFRLRGDGQLFGGRLQVRSTIPLEEVANWGEVLGSLAGGELEFRGVSLGRLIRAVPVGAGVPKIEGRVDGSARIATDAQGVTTSESGWAVRGLVVGDLPISREVRAAVRTEGSEIVIRSFCGRYAGGQIDGNGRWSLGGGPRLVEVRFAGVDGNRFLVPVMGRDGVPIDGRLSGRTTLTGVGPGAFDTFRVVGSVRVREGVAWGVPIGDARAPIRLTYGREPAAWQVVFPRVRSSLAGGALEGRLAVASAAGGRPGFRMDSDWRFRHVDFEHLLSTYVGGRTLGRGNLTGELQIGGRGIRGVKDLRGDFRARLGGTDATAVPAISAAASLLGPVALAGNRFTSGNLSGTIVGGAARIGELSLVGEQMRVAAEGRVGLEDGRMDLQTVIATGNFEAQRVALALLLERVVVPVSAVATVNRIANDRTLVLNVTGTVRDPQLRVMAAPTIRANTRRILLRETIGLTLPESVWLATE